jgi:NitT/TauT family transport system permease protein
MANSASGRTFRIVPTVSVFMLLSTWEGACLFFAIPRYLLPAPHEVLVRLFFEIHTFLMWQHIWATFSVALVGMCIALCMGIAFGWASFHSKFFQDATQWVVISTQAVPVIAIAPLFFLWVQSEYWSRVMVTVVITFFPLYSATYTSLQRIPRELREVASLEGYTRRQAWQTYEAALAAPVIFAGVRTSMVLATTGAVVGEYLGGRYGLGALINIARGMFDTTLVFVAIVILITMTLSFSYLFHTVETWVLRAFDD